MGRRKGELTKKQLDRRWPHQVALPASRCGGERFRFMHAFCLPLSLAPRHHWVRRNDVDYIVFCFAEEAHAAQFGERFGGERFEPAMRGRGHQWFRWRDAKPKTCARR